MKIVEWVPGQHRALWAASTSRLAEVVAADRKRIHRASLLCTGLGGGGVVAWGILWSSADGVIASGCLVVLGSVVAFSARKRYVPRHSKKAPRALMPPPQPTALEQRGDKETIPFKAVLLDPDSTITTELPLPAVYRGAESD